ncbi:MAG: glycosyltransferase [Planctomycetota bacterium]|nr:glycosyltransferase [Planctomycetota bacterium]
MLSAVVLHYRRPDALAHTLASLRAAPRCDEIIVVDNASADDTPDRVPREFPGVRVLALDANRGVEGFNRGVLAARGDLLLILDDDASPDPDALRAALDLLAREPGVVGVALHPRHPRTGATEWPFAREARGGFPVMGCANIVRRDAWDRVGGYEPAFFLYRNDVDLALKLLGAGLDVRFDPAWVAWHDSPAAARKSDRWLRLATRNWVWLAKRHGRGVPALLGGVAGVARALLHAGANPARVRRVLAGAWEGLATPAPALPSCVARDGRAWRAFMRLRRGRTPTPPGASSGRA